MREETIEHRLDDTFQFDHSFSLVCNEVSMSDSINHNANNADIDVSCVQPSACNTNFNHNNNNGTFTSLPRCLVCASRHYGSDDLDKCPYR